MKERNLKTPEELINKMELLCTTEDMIKARAIYEAFKTTESATDSDQMWSFMCLLGAVYVAGRVEGIREERSRRKAAAEKKAV